MQRGRHNTLKFFSSEDDEEEEKEEEEKISAQEEGYETTEEEHPTLDIGKIVALSRVPRFHTLRLKGSIQGQKVTVLVHGGSTKKFIYVALVEKRKLQDETLMFS